MLEGTEEGDVDMPSDEQFLYEDVEVGDLEPPTMFTDAVGDVAAPPPMQPTDDIELSDEEEE